MTTRPTPKPQHGEIIPPTETTPTHEDHAAYRSGYAHGVRNSFLPCPYATGTALFWAWMHGYKDGIAKWRYDRG